MTLLRSFDNFQPLELLKYFLEKKEFLLKTRQLSFSNIIRFSGVQYIYPSASEWHQKKTSR